jgi:hypothetical protein
LATYHCCRGGSVLFFHRKAAVRSSLCRAYC